MNTPPAPGPRPPAKPASVDRNAPSPAPNGLAGVRSWGYQLQDLDIARAAASPFDLLVVDFAFDGDADTALTPVDVARLQRRPDGGRRIVLAYISIGEAESYRSYWRKDWKRQRPAWLLRENPEWHENYAVCFWDAGWQELLCGRPDAYLDLILGQGFDGIYLDKCDVTEDLKRHEKAAAKTRSDLDGDMVALVATLAGYARARRPGFLVVMQNAEPLLERAPLRALIDGVAKEELLFGLDGSQKPNDGKDTAWSRERLDLVASEGKPVFVVEYLNDAAKIAKAATAIRDMGYVGYISDKSRDLDRLAYRTPVG